MKALSLSDKWGGSESAESANSNHNFGYRYQNYHAFNVCFITFLLTFCIFLRHPFFDFMYIYWYFFVKTYTDIYLYVLHNTYKNIFNVHTFPKISVMYRTILSWFVFVSCHICYWHVTIKILKWTSMWAQMLQSKRIMFYFLWLNFFVFSFC